MPRILDLSFSPLTRDARVLRQLSVVSEFAEVTTCGYGPATPYSHDHVEIPADAPSLPQTPRGVVDLALRRHRASDLAAPGSAAVLDRLAMRRFDLVIANDARALPLAHAVADGAPIWADLHEWAPEERTHVIAWRLLVAPWIDSVCRRYLPLTAAQTTVGTRIAALYEERYGVRPLLMRNAAPYADLAPSPVAPDGPLRLVHSGAAIPGRGLDAMIDAVLTAGDSFRLDLYLVAGGDRGAHLRDLRARAAGCERVVFHDPVPPAALPATLNAYDVGVFWIPPTTTNARLTLPNKLFDFVQARLALAVGPSIEMAEIVGEHRLGVVSDGFEVERIVDSLRTLTPQRVAAFKEASHRAAPALSFEHEAQTARRILSDLLGA
ncbi:hypothetical protein M3T53_02770 [Actinomyces sp. B33]|uniref:hypothetical protein n=1 Tax=Actinomyces sp. B33 TaxID=2942131 RepID=UPI00233FA062|nr:hypothetical protein [Actinomyces sp. B33]MDC4232638.1 hypothetical protein [Actinomyces sp. B33]